MRKVKFAKIKIGRNSRENKKFARSMLHDNYTTITRQLHDNYTTITRQLHDNYTTITRQLHDNYTTITRQLYADYTTIIRLQDYVWVPSSKQCFSLVVHILLFLEIVLQRSNGVNNLLVLLGFREVKIAIEKPSE